MERRDGPSGLKGLMAATWHPSEEKPQLTPFMRMVARHTYRGGDVPSLGELYLVNTVGPRQLERLRAKAELDESRRVAEDMRRLRQDAWAREVSTR